MVFFQPVLGKFLDAAQKDPGGGNLRQKFFVVGGVVVAGRLGVGGWRVRFAGGSVRGTCDFCFELVQEGSRQLESSGMDPVVGLVQGALPGHFGISQPNGKVPLLPGQPQAFGEAFDAKVSTPQGGQPASPSVLNFCLVLDPGKDSRKGGSVHVGGRSEWRNNPHHDGNLAGAGKVLSASRMDRKGHPLFVK